jgi:NDP-sugar pyrophosphorylase family protein
MWWPGAVGAAVVITGAAVVLDGVKLGDVVRVDSVAVDDVELGDVVDVERATVGDGVPCTTMGDGVPGVVCAVVTMGACTRRTVRACRGC